MSRNKLLVGLVAWLTTSATVTLAEHSGQVAVPALVGRAVGARPYAPSEYPGIFRLRMVYGIKGGGNRPYKLADEIITYHGSAIGIRGCILTAGHNCERLTDNKPRRPDVIFASNGSTSTSIVPDSVRVLGGYEHSAEKDICVARLTRALPGSYSPEILSAERPSVNLFGNAVTVGSYDLIKKEGLRMTAVGFGGQLTLTPDEIKFLNSSATPDKKVELLAALHKLPATQRIGSAYLVGSERDFRSHIEKLAERAERSAARKEAGLGEVLLAEMLKTDLENIKGFASGETALVCAQEERPLIPVDSGGALFYQDKSGQKRLVGVISMRDIYTELKGLGISLRFGIYASVPEHLGWIRQQLKELDCLGE